MADRESMPLRQRSEPISEDLSAATDSLLEPRTSSNGHDTTPDTTHPPMGLSPTLLSLETQTRATAVQPDPRRRHRVCTTRFVKWALVVACLTMSIYLWSAPHSSHAYTSLFALQQYRPAPFTTLKPITTSKGYHKKDPDQWFRDHSSGTLKTSRNVAGSVKTRPRAAIISLVRNEELDGILQSMRQLEQRWNHGYRYPWIFFSEQPFKEEFKALTANATSAQVSYELIPRSHWSPPSHIDQDRYMDSLDYLGTIGVGKGYMLSYRNMCRWNSGFFYKHPALASYDYYWRVEPDVHFFCDIKYDPFRFMRDMGMVYGFNMNILDDARSFASLWRRTQVFAQSRPDLVHPGADVAWLVDEHNAGDYNNCQFFSNFEIGDLNFFRGEANEAYFDFLDQSGGFYYERFGDAPVHTLSVTMFAPKDKVWFFRDIGYQHDIARHCPADGVLDGRCTCEPTGLDENFYKLVPMESPQKKPTDTCIRQWLGGKWLDKKEGWDQDIERAFGGDGYGGYVKAGIDES